MHGDAIAQRVGHPEFLGPSLNRRFLVGRRSVMLIGMARGVQWSDRLARTVRDRRGNTIATREEAGRYILALPQFRKERW